MLIYLKPQTIRYVKPRWTQQRGLPEAHDATRREAPEECLHSVNRAATARRGSIRTCPMYQITRAMRTESRESA